MTAASFQGPISQSPYTGMYKFLPTSKRIIQFSDGMDKEPKVFIDIENFAFNSNSWTRFFS